MDIPAGTKRRFGLDDERSLIVQCESNRLVWPGPDPRPVDDDTAYYGPVPLALFADIRQRFVALARSSAQYQ